MKAAVLTSADGVTKRPLRIEEVAKPEPAAGQVLLRVRACGVCRTDLHIVEGELHPLREVLIPGHQIVGEIIQGATAELALGTRVGVSWVGGTDGTCWYLQASPGESLRFPDLHRLRGKRRIRGVRCSRGPTSFFLFPRRSTTCTPRRCCAPASSAFAASVSPAWNEEKESACSALARPLIWPP